MRYSGGSIQSSNTTDRITSYLQVLKTIHLISSIIELLYIMLDSLSVTMHIFL